MAAPLSSLEAGELASSSAVTVGLTGPVSRFSLRARGDVTSLADALEVPLPERIGACAASGSRRAVRLGPDEWVLKASIEDAAAMVSASEAIYAGYPHSLVDVSGREVTLDISGPRASDLLTLGMARDPEAIPVGEARRLNFDGVTVLLWRLERTRYEMDSWNSFAPHILGLLKTGVAELAAEIA
ncbi:MAG: sarcosine oxidase subunit gamma family protein [Pseudomonadota bacterium]